MVEEKNAIVLALSSNPTFPRVVDVVVRLNGDDQKGVRALVKKSLSPEELRNVVNALSGAILEDIEDALTR